MNSCILRSGFTFAITKICIRRKIFSKSIAALVACILCITGTEFASIKHADAAIVVGHDINTLGSFIAGTQEETFAVNVASFLTSDSVAKDLLLFESSPTDGRRDYSTGVVNALSNAGFSVTVTPDYTTEFETFNRIFR